MPLFSTRAGVAESYPAAGASDSGVKAHVSHVSACVCVRARVRVFYESILPACGSSVWLPSRSAYHSRVLSTQVIWIHFYLSVSMRGKQKHTGTGMCGS
jgi:hypothetical protein